MARRRKPKFKELANVHLEALSSGNDWSSFAVIQKSQDSMKGAWAESARVSFIIEDNESSGDEIGILFCASHDDALDSTTPANNTGQIISSSASRSPGGVVTLPLKRLITRNSTDQTDGESQIFLHAMCTNMNSTVDIYMIVEVMGRWHKVSSL